MKNIKLLLVFFAAFFLGAFILLDKIGGNFSAEPSEYNLTPQAKLLVERAYQNININRLTDYHVHIIGTDIEAGTFVNPKSLTWLNPIHRLKTSVYLSSSAVSDIDNSNQQYIERLIKLINSQNHPGKYHILAFDYYYNKDGTQDKNKSEFYVSNEYIWQLHKKFPNIFEPVISVHPYKPDAVAELTEWGKKKVRYVKWLPNAQGMNASDPDLEEYYKTMKKYDMVLLTHVGEEKAVEAEENQELGNPLLFRYPLNMGVKIIMAHCASAGENEDLDNPGNKISSFDLFMRLMDEPKYENLLYGEISAVTLINHLPVPLLTLLDRTDLHPRLLNGSDYPLPAINILIHTKYLRKHGFITKEEAASLNEIYKNNPLLFDFVLKRTVKHPQSGNYFKETIFENNL